MKQAKIMGYPIELGITAASPEIPPSHRLLTPEQQEIQDAIWTLQTYGRGRIVESATVGPWIQTDHDREHVPKLQAAIDVLERHGMIERHPTKGNPRNVRIVRVAK